MGTVRTILKVTTRGTGLYEITEQVDRWLDQAGADDGLLTLFCQHTSASLLITENASPAVQRDMLRWLGKVAPERADYEHFDERADDMPAHLKAALTGNSLTIPVAGGRMMLGTWQGVFLAEHRAAAHARTIVGYLLADRAE